MKERLTLRNVVIWGAAFIGLLFFFLSFAVSAKLTFAEENHFAEYTFGNAIWNGGSIVGKDNGRVIVEGTVQGSPFALPIVGIVLVLVSALAAAIISFAVKDEKIKKYALIGAGVISVTGGIFVFFVGETAVRTYCVLSDYPLSKLDYLKNILKANGAEWGPGALGIITGIFSILSGCAYAASQFLPEKKLIK